MPVVVALAAAPEEEAALAALRVEVVPGPAGAAPAYVRRQVAPRWPSGVGQRRPGVDRQRPRRRRGLSHVDAALLFAEVLGGEVVPVALTS